MELLKYCEEKNQLYSINQKKNIGRNPNDIVSAYKDNVALLKVTICTKKSADKPDFTEEKRINVHYKAETHNFPTTVEPFNGAATGSGGEIRDRLAGGQGSLPLAGTALHDFLFEIKQRSMKKRWKNVLGCIKHQWIFYKSLKWSFRFWK
jgi:phosphoribosylformylglycinamidine synthase